MDSPLDTWVVDFVAPKLNSNTRKRPYRLDDTTTLDNLIDQDKRQ